MTYIEIAVSDGPGTLTSHEVVVNGDFDEYVGYVMKRNDCIAQTLTEQEYQDFIEMHGGNIAT